MTRFNVFLVALGVGFAIGYLSEISGSLSKIAELLEKILKK